MDIHPLLAWIELDNANLVGQDLAVSPKITQIPPKAPRQVEKASRRIEVLAFPDVQMLDVAGPIQVFTAANERATSSHARLPYETRVIAPEGAQIRATSGLAFATEPLPDPAEPLDTLIVAGGGGVMRAAEDANLVGWLKRRAGAARRTASVCTGAFLLAATGLLDHRRAATHWEYCDELSRRHPAVTVEPDPIFVHDGPVWSSAGVTAGIDLSLALVEEDLGRAMALSVARQLVVFLKRPGGQAQFSATLSLQSADERFANLHGWLAGHLAEDLPLSRLASQAGMSERTFLRRYREATGLTPARAIERLRVEAARQLLADTRLPAKRIAARCGFGSEETMRRNFARLQGVSPQDYRQRFGGA
ncbi:MAG TPA: GlxA family transcriptional regulator [Roseiarcus sp.]|jgi:transcriptional regulator GlxA family with amidase domain